MPEALFDDGFRDALTLLVGAFVDVPLAVRVLKIGEEFTAGEMRTRIAAARARLADEGRA